MSAPSVQAPAELAPVAAAERVELIDILRGFALLGILVVNFWGNSGETARGLDKVVSDVLDIAVSSSFYPLFSFLFGLGFALQLSRARAGGANVVRLYLRRMLALFLIGAFHAIVIWNGDILVTYAVLGILLIPLHRVSDRWLLPLAAFPLIAGLWGPTVRGFAARIGGESATESVLLADVAAQERIGVVGHLNSRYEIDSTATRRASFTTSIVMRWQQFQARVRNLLSRNSFLNDIPAFFLLGFVVGRRRILQEPERHRPGLTWAAVIGLVGAVAGTIVVWVVEPDSPFIDSLAWSFSDYGATMFYISGISLGVTFSSTAAKAFRRFAPAGRIGLTNYLLQSTTMTLLFSHYGASLTPPPTAVWLVINVAFFFAVQLPLSRWWIRRFRFGPAEWVWRSLTYGSPQPMRLGGSAHVPGAYGVGTVVASTK